MKRGKLCEECNDGKTEGFVSTVYGIDEKVRCEFHYNLLNCEIETYPVLKRQYQIAAGIKV